MTPGGTDIPFFKRTQNMVHDTLALGEQTLSGVQAQQDELARQRQAYGDAVAARQGPDFAPADGVSLDTYVDILFDIDRAGGSPTPEQFAPAHGVEPATFLKASDVWTQRSMANPIVGQAINNEINLRRRGH